MSARKKPGRFLSKTEARKKFDEAWNPAVTKVKETKIMKEEDWKEERPQVEAKVLAALA